MQIKFLTVSTLILFCSTTFPAQAGADICPAVWDPVCGVDGNTYGNDCEAGNAGVIVNYYGECAECIDGVTTFCRNDLTLETFTSVQAAIDDLDAGDNDTINIVAARYDEDVAYDRNIILTLSGGWYCDFSDNPGTSSINSLTVGDGTAIIENVVIQSSPTVTYRFTGEVTAVYPAAPDFPAEYLSVAVGDTISGEISLAGTGVENPFGIWEQSTSYLFLAASSSLEGSIGSTPFSFSDNNLQMSIWNNDQNTLLTQTICDPSTDEYDGYLVSSSASESDMKAPAIFLGDYCLPVTAFEDESLPKTSIMGPGFFNLLPSDLSTTWIIGTIDSFTVE